MIRFITALVVVLVLAALTVAARAVFDTNKASQV